MKIYISGPIKDNPNYIEDFNSAKQRLISLGLDPLSPLDCDPREHEGDCPGGYVSGEGTHSSTCYMRADLLAMLLQCDTIYMMENWEMSKGARLELAVAQSCGFGIVYYYSFME